MDQTIPWIRPLEWQIIHGPKALRRATWRNRKPIRKIAEDPVQVSQALALILKTRAVTSVSEGESHLKFMSS